MRRLTWSALLLVACARTAQDVPAPIPPDATVVEVAPAQPDLTAPPDVAPASDALRADWCQHCVGNLCKVFDSCIDCPSTRRAEGQACPVDGFSCYFGPRCAGTLCECRRDGDSTLHWRCRMELCRR